MRDLFALYRWTLGTGQHSVSVSYVAWYKHVYESALLFTSNPDANVFVRRKIFKSSICRDNRHSFHRGKYCCVLEEFVHTCLVIHRIFLGCEK